MFTSFHIKIYFFTIYVCCTDSVGWELTTYCGPDFEQVAATTFVHGVQFHVGPNAGIQNQPC